jgi:rubrerythrin
MALLKSEPPAAVRSLGELFALANQMELDAARRYAELAEAMRAQGSERSAAVFARLADEEARHVEAVAEMCVGQTGEPPAPSEIRWLPPETLDVEGIDATDPRLVSEYKALSMAVRNEERAFAFWSFVAAQAGPTAVRQAAERMAHVELEHVALLRRERRRAYHAQRRTRPAGSTPSIQALELHLAEACEQGARRATENLAGRLTEVAAEARRMAGEVAEAGLPPPAAADLPIEATDSLVAVAELLVDRYLEAAELAKDEATVARAQSFAQSAIARLAWLRSNLPMRPAAGQS